ncbi:MULTISPECIES: hypothetical protein [unclassified Shewanella]|uniref:hypothetical protein n=1 Tax=unclassified Shewanella TaxID=196818 RepID=UPI000C8147EB|nr:MULTISPECIES: hypothetical protein [unclassified Shewanella]MDO6619462.1 hypothetical protein [Shewanella sp. 6_MG-2023]MDO6639416.1 hypothetical protein [Shewanella sp. 5_MG-2023]MDO6678177.1 hypothetical protein [Shewanella sp. 4_MG-2023]MDO6775916.1 hypothetical protein [Shewanella sp. 3_MG-2023]
MLLSWFTGFKANQFPLYKSAVIAIAALFVVQPCQAQFDADNPDLSHYAFANYIGSGIYRASGQSAAVANIPFAFDIEQADDHLLTLRLPVSLGFFNYSFSDLPEGELPDGVGTMTITPGIEYKWFYDEQLTLETYLDLGYGHNFSNSSNVGIFSTGFSALYELAQPKYNPVWVNRIYYAGYKSSINDSSDGYSVLQSGIDFGLNQRWDWGEYTVEPRLFVAGRWYFDKLKFVTPVQENVLTQYSYEVGVTLALSKPLGWGWFSTDRFGMSYQTDGELQVWRLIFEFPM